MQKKLRMRLSSVNTHVKTVYYDKGDYLLIKMTFRGKNAFGGKVLNTVTAKADLNGNVLEVSEPK